MRAEITKFTIVTGKSIRAALAVIDENKQGFVIVIDGEDRVQGVLTDGDVRRAILKGLTVEDSVDIACSRKPRIVHIDDSMERVAECFKSEKIKLLPIVDDNGVLQNVITKSQMHTMLLLNVQADLSYNFQSLDTSVVDHEIFLRPWGFFKTTVLNNYYQSKIICIKPLGKISLQSHVHREEYWVIVHGNGSVYLDGSIIDVKCGSMVFVPKGSKHRIINNDKYENLVVSEIQIGDYLGEDDIIRYDDDYNRAVVREEDSK